MSRYTQFGILCVWLFVAALVLCALSSDTMAREPQPGFVSPIDGMVGGEPGEDPHLRFAPETKVEPIWLPEGGGVVGSPVHAAIGGPEARVEGAPRGHVYVETWWRMLVIKLSRVLFR